MSDPGMVTELRLCKFPECARLAVSGQDGDLGRPSEYCDDPAHNRAAAWRLRKRSASPANTPSGVVGADERLPVNVARQRASELRGQVEGIVGVLETQLSSFLHEMRTLADPGAAEAQIESVTADAVEKVAAAEARASRAEHALQNAESQRAEADAVAQEAESTALQLQSDMEKLSSELVSALAAKDAVSVELADLRVAAFEREQVLREQLGELQAAAADIATARDSAVASVTDSENRAQETTERADRANGTIIELRDQLEQTNSAAVSLQNDLIESVAALATAKAERDGAIAEVAREVAHSNQRVEDHRALYMEQVTALRYELAELKRPAKP